jgi:hypothetical protein
LSGGSKPGVAGLPRYFLTGSMMMKKVFVLIMCVTAWGAVVFAQSGGADVSLLNVGAYVSSLGVGKMGDGRAIVPDKYEEPLSDEEYYSVAKVGGKPDIIDTDYEALLTTYYFQKATTIRPPEAVRELPANSRTSELRMGAAVYMDMQAARFLGGDPAPCAAALKFITDRGRVTEANIKDFVKQGIAAAVDAEFNRVSFGLSGSPNGSYNAILIQNANNQYILSYEGYFNGAFSNKTLLPANSLQALSSAMSLDNDFNQACIDQVRAQAAQIPAVRLSKEAMNDIAVILEQFYTRPTTETYGYLKDVYNLYIRTWLTSQNRLFENVADSYISTLSSLNQPLAKKVINDRDIVSNIVLSREVQRKLTSFR